MTAVLQPPKTYTADEFMAMDFPDDGNYYELVNGEVVVNIGPGDLHGRVSMKLFIRLGSFVEQNGLGQAYGPTAFTLAPKTLRVPDAAFVTKERVTKVTKKAVPVPPDLAIEVISTSDVWSKIRDKIVEYQQVGVPLVWVIDPEGQTVFIYHLADGLVGQIIGANAVLDGENIVPNFTLPVADLFA